MKARKLLADSGHWIPEDPVGLISDFLPRDPPRIRLPNLR